MRKATPTSQTGSTKSQEVLEEFLFSSILQKKNLNKVCSFKVKKVEYFIMLNRHKLVMSNEVHSFFLRVEQMLDIYFCFL